jgi:carboxyl-terminal processing protease
MKKLFILSTILIWFLTPASFAEEQPLTLGETLTMYFTEIFPILTPEISNVTVKYSGIGTRSGLRGALQRGIYYEMLPNTAATLRPDEPMSDRAFSQLLRHHFWTRIASDDSLLTPDDYERFMVSIRTSFAYRVFRLLNTPEENTAPVSVSPESKLSQADNYYLLENIYNLLQQNYLRGEKFNQAELIYGAAEWLVNELGDQHTKFFRPDASTDFKNSLDGNIVGIGVIIDIDATGSLTITDVIRHSPAEKAGLSSGDKIIKIDGIAVSTENGIIDDIARLRWQAQTQVEVTVQSGKVIKTVAIVREIIHVEQVETEELTDSYRIIFWEVATGTDIIMEGALQGFLSSGKKRLILDLRNNPGGSLAETRSILNYWIDKWNPLVVLKYPKLEVLNYALNDSLTDWTKYEIVILINGDTASAAEIIAATIREYYPRNSVIIGDTSYGKWTVQELVSFDDKSLLKYTIAEWLIPRTRKSINKVGIVPDKKVVFDRQHWRTKKIDTQLLAAQQYNFSN